MKLSAVLELRDRLSAQMEKAGKSVSAMTERVNESRNAIQKIAETQNIHLSIHSNISETISAAKASIISLKNTIAEKELSLQTKVDLDDIGEEAIAAKLNELGSFLNKNANKIEQYNNQLAILRQRQKEFTESTKGSVKLGVEQSIESLEKKLEDIEAAKKQFAEWQQIRLDYNDLELARSELSTLEQAVKNLNRTNIAVRAYLDFKTDALKQIYDLDRKIITPIVKLKDQVTEKIRNIKSKAKILAQEKFTPVISTVDKTKSVIASVQTNLAKVAGTVAYPVIKIKDTATNIITKIKNKLKVFSKEKTTHKVKLDAQQVFNTIKTIQAKLSGLGAKAGKAFAGVTTKIAKGLAISVGVASTIIGGVGAASIKTGAQFEASMSQVAATMGMSADQANYSNKAYAKLANKAKEMGATTKFSASESAEALNYLALAGYDADQACKALPTILDLAAAGGMELAAASDMITDSMSALGLATTKENLTAFGDQMARAAQRSNTSVSQLGEAILTVGGTAKTLAGGTTELNTLLGIIADNGTKGSEGGTALRNILLSLQAPTDTATKQLKALGLSVYDAKGKMRPMNEVLTDLNSSMQHMTDRQKQNVLSTIFNKTDLKSVTALLSGTTEEISNISSVLKKKYHLQLDTQDINRFSELLKKSNGEIEVANAFISEFGLSSQQAEEAVKDLEKSIPRFDLLSGWIEDSDGAMANMAETMSDNLQGRITEFSSALESVKIAIFEALGNSNLKGLVKEASGWITELTKATDEGGINGLVEAFGSIFAKVVTKITSMTPKIVQAGVGLVSNLISGVKSNLPQITKGITDTQAVFLEGILQLIPELILLGIDSIDQLAGGITEQLPQLLDCGTEAIIKLAEGIINRIPKLAHTAIQIIQSLSHSLSKNMQPILSAALKILKELGNGVIKAIPVLVPVIVQLIQNFASFIAENLKSITEVALTILIALVQGLTEAIPTLLPVVIQIITELVSFISENLDMVITVALDILMALVEGLINSIPVIIPAVVEIIEQFIQFMSNNLPLILEEGLEIILMLVQGIVDNLPQLVDGAIQIITSLTTFLKENFPLILETAGKIVVELIKGLIEAIPQLVDGALELVDVIWNTIKDINWLQLGIDLIKGIGNGLSEGIKAIGETIGNVASSIVDKFKSFLGIHSPSTVMKAEVGVYVGAGVAEGLKETKATLNKEVENLTDDMTVTMGANLSKIQTPILQSVQIEGLAQENILKTQKIIPFELLKSTKNPKQPKKFSKENNIYQNLEIAQPITDTKENHSYSSVTENKNQKQSIKKYYIEKIIENVTITGEADEDRLIKKIMDILADDIDDTEDNMGEEEWA